MTLGTETTRMERTGQRPFQVERKAVLHCRFTMGKADCGASEPMSWGPGKWWVLSFSQMHHSPFWNIRQVWPIDRCLWEWEVWGSVGSQQRQHLYFSGRRKPRRGNLWPFQSTKMCQWKVSMPEVWVSSKACEVFCHQIQRCGLREFWGMGDTTETWRQMSWLTLKKSVSYKKRTWTSIS